MPNINNTEKSKLIIEQLIFRQFDDNNRYTQDSPVYPEVWLEYAEHLSKLDTYRCDLILTPHRKSSAPELLAELFRRLKAQAGDASTKQQVWCLASTGESVAVKVTLAELVWILLPLTDWWANVYEAGELKSDKPAAIWLQELVGALYFLSDPVLVDVDTDDITEQRELYRSNFTKNEIKSKEAPLPWDEPKLFAVSKNRRAKITMQRSVPATKADAGRRVFDIDGADISWAVIDTGIDARHSGFRRIDSTTGKPFPEAMEAKHVRLSDHSRIIATYDFTKFRDILVMATAEQPKKLRRGKNLLEVTGDKQNSSLKPAEITNLITEAAKDLQSGRLLDWSVISPLLRIPHNSEEYVPPRHSHGTHVAGIIGAHKRSEIKGSELVGMCPGINLYDIRVLDSSGEGDEFNILAALQFVRWMNTQRDGVVIHGVNLSFSMIHEVASYGCGQTPVCVSCDRLVSEGTVVVAAAGNMGQAMFLSPLGDSQQGFRMVNISDPGNAESIITVGSTHSNRPHSYGVSYFSSKGPTGDGRQKPDLVAPGEKIESTCIEDSTERRDGTSMAAPHVSGAAALLLAKHRELIGNPKKVKEILCATATDLGREKYFQGAGMIDVLRAIQYV